MALEDVLRDHLTPREEQMIKNYFGLNKSSFQHSIEDLAMRYELPEERVRQILQKAFRKLGHEHFKELL